MVESGTIEQRRNEVTEPSSLSSRVTFRDVTTADREFLFQVFESASRSNFMDAGLADESLEQILEMQFAAQDRGYSQTFPAADRKLICLSGKPVGRLYVSRTQNEIRLVEMTLLENVRNQGVGACVIRELINEAVELQVPLRLSVAFSNRALSLYQRLGFREIEQQSTTFTMEWSDASKNVF